ncbi:hypothetical protein EDC02_5218 [Micromonospora sp. Llam0]|uniref:hypothetical protein n=1 Tax=Micromonospora sp. Llam0 TaxID=2485143 RepID=UPI000F490717|nr:hypothetical protein [Micromonospora sp. Llam0]ROO63198.1 hypothetical protein EDC02_5218 [Micromonospora sp. Llam0]
MADETRIDPDGARRMFRVLGEVGKDLDVALSGVYNIRSTVVEPWGNDDYGRPFAGQREENAKDTLKAVGFVVEGLTGLSEEGVGAIDEFEKLDEENSKRLRPDN